MTDDFDRIRLYHFIQRTYGFSTDNMLITYLDVKIAYDDMPEVLSAKFLQYPCLADLTRTTQYQRFPARRILPFRQLMLYASFH